jgi:Domain of unknown function (DUF4181)
VLKEDILLDNFWLKLFLLLAIYGVLISVFNMVMRKWFKVEKKKFFSYNHLNNLHKKIEWSIRIIFLVLLIVGTIINLMRINKDLEKIWFLETYILMFVFIIVTEIIRAFMERKYAANKNDYLFTIIQLVFISILLSLTFTTDYFGLV